MMWTAMTYTITAKPTIIMMVDKKVLIHFPIEEVIIMMGNKKGVIDFFNEGLIHSDD